jgi:hypothetical protein
VGDFIKANTPLPARKVDARPPIIPEQEIDAADVNNLWDAAADLRTHTGGWVDLVDHLPAGYVTDGTADYATQIGTATAAAGGKTLRLPAGTFRHSTGLTFANVNVEGEGPDKTILLFAGAGQAVKGKWATLYDIRGNNNIFIGGDAEMNNSAATITQVFRISGGGNKFRDTYVEQIGATFPALFINFTSTAISNVFDGVYLTASGVKNLDATITDAGTGNEFRAGPIGAGFPAQGRNVAPQNLLPNSGFASMRTATLPLGYTDIFGTGTISRDTVTVRGSLYSMKLDVAAARAGIATYLATNSPATRFPIDPMPIAKLRGRTITASVWINSNAANVGAIKIFDGASNIGSAVHTGSGNWELLTVTTKVLTTANEVGIQLRTDSDGAAKTGTVYFSEPLIAFGNEAPHQTPRPLNDYAASMAGRLSWAPPPTLTLNSTQPSVLDGNFFLASNTGATGIINFLNGVAGQEIKILTTTANTTLVNGATLVTTTGANKALTSGVVYKLIYDGTKWWEF